MKMWMVEGLWEIEEGLTVPVRSVVLAKTKKTANEGAPEAVRRAVEAMMRTTEPPGRAVGDPAILYAM